MAILTEGPRKAEFMISEAESYRARDNATVTIPANTTFSAGTVLGRITATGKYVRHDAALVNGAQVARAVLFENVQNATGSSADFKATVIARSTQVKKADLIYMAGATGPQILTTDAELVAAGIVVR